MISDLGAITCGYHPVGSNHYICSPQHGVMNGSFIVQGVLIGGGAFLLRRAFPSGRLSRIANALLLFAGASLTVVGFVPEDAGSSLHGIAAVIHLLSGNLGMLLLGISLLKQETPKRPALNRVGWVSLVMGVVGLTAIILLGFRHDFGIGPGAMERIGGYPLPLWLTSMGIYLLATGEADA